MANEKNVYEGYARNPRRKGHISNLSRKKSRLKKSS